MPARKRAIPVAAGADPAEAAVVDWSRFSWLDAERSFGQKIPEQARFRIKQATNHFARLAQMEDATPPMAKAAEEIAKMQSLTARLLRRVSKFTLNREAELERIASQSADVAKVQQARREIAALQNEIPLREFVGHRIRQQLRLPPGRNLGRAAIGADHLSIFYESLRTFESSLSEIGAELAKPEPSPELREWQRWLGHICAALTENGLPATASNETKDTGTPLMSLVRRLLEVLPAAIASKYDQKENAALAKAIQRSRRASKT